MPSVKQMPYQRQKTDYLAEKFTPDKKEMGKKDIRIVYTYKNNNGEEFVRVEITSDDL